MLINATLRNRYRVLQVLGSGGFGDTYLAEDLDLPGHPQCVVKHFKPKDLNPRLLPIAQELFEREANTLYQLGNEHDQIPKLFAHFVENGEFYLVQEFIRGETLAEQLLPSVCWSEAKVVQLLQEILTVLQVVHQRNIIHRDVNPRNLIRRIDGKLVLIDFGAVKEIRTLLFQSQGQASLTVGIGTPGYMPSEQAQGKPKFSSDIYAIGMIGIQALTGIVPHYLPEDSLTGEVLWRDRALDVSDHIATVLDKMVRSRWNERYTTVTETLDALNAAIAPPVVSAPPRRNPMPSTIIV